MTNTETETKCSICSFVMHLDYAPNYCGGCGKRLEPDETWTV